jgi:hypothetical protein
MIRHNKLIYGYIFHPRRKKESIFCVYRSKVMSIGGLKKAILTFIFASIFAMRNKLVDV